MLKQTRYKLITDKANSASLVNFLCTLGGDLQLPRISACGKGISRPDPLGPEQAAQRGAERLSALALLSGDTCLSVITDKSD